MAKLFSSQDVKLLLEQHSRRLSSLKAASGVSQQYLSQIKTTSDNLAMQEVMNVLRGVPIDELTKQKKGLKIKHLLDNGYRTVADVYSSTPYRLASIRGISQDAAYTIKASYGTCQKYSRIQSCPPDRFLMQSLSK